MSQAHDNTAQRSLKPGARRTCLLVLGAHRSGTSALSRLLNIHGCDLPATLMGPNLGNDEGHWESSVIAAFNDDLLQSAGSRWDDCQPVSDNWYASPRHTPYLAEARRLLVTEFDGSPLFVLKDPRICRLAPFWLDALESSDVDCAIVLPIRRADDVAGSLERRDETREPYGKLLWLRHVLDAERDTRGRRRIFTSFDELIRDWRTPLGAISSGLDIQFPRVSAISASEADRFIRGARTSEQRSFPSAKLTRRPEMGSWTNDCLVIFDRWIAHGEQTEDYSILDQIRSDLDRAVHALAAALLPDRAAGMVGEGARARRDLQEEFASQVEQGKKLAAEAKERGAAAEARAADLEERLQGVTSQLEAAQVSLFRAGEEHTAQLEALAAARVDDADEAATKIGELRANLADALAIEQQRADVIGTTEAQASRLEKKVAALTWELDEVRASLVYADKERARQRKMLENARAKEAAGPTAPHRSSTTKTSSRSGSTADLQHQETDPRLKKFTTFHATIRSSLSKAQRSLTDQIPEPTAPRRSLGQKLRGAPAPLRTKIFDSEWLARQRTGLGKTSLADYLGDRSLHEVDPHPLFSAKEYLANNPDVAASGIAPLRHYVLHGWREGRNPHRWFANNWYLLQNPDVLAQSNINPLDHYLRFGWREGRWPNPVFDPRAYIGRHRDVAQADIEPLTHFAMFGDAESRELGGGIDPDWRAFVPTASRSMSPIDYLMHEPVFDAVEALTRSPARSVIADDRVAPKRRADRPRSKPHVLFIDHAVPQWDQDAGSRTIYQYIQLMLDNDCLVTFWPDNLRYDPQYTPRLEELGLEVIHDANLEVDFDTFLAEREGSYDLAFLSRPHIAEKYIDTIRRRSRAQTLYYGHDLHFRRMEAARAIGERVAQEDIDYHRQLELGVCRKCDVIFYPDPEEVRFVADEIGGDREFIANPVFVYADKEIARGRARLGSIAANHAARLFFVGGFDHAPNREGIVWFVRDVLPLVMNRVPGVTLDILGSKPPAVVLDLTSDQVHVRGFVPDEELQRYYDNASLAIAPLRYGAGVKGKVIEAMANGVPVATTPTGAQGIEDRWSDGPGHERKLFVGESAAQMADAVVQALTDRNAATRRAAASLDFIGAHYSRRSLQTLFQRLVAK